MVVDNRQSAKQFNELSTLVQSEQSPVKLRTKGPVPSISRLLLIGPRKPFLGPIDIVSVVS
jgi:hypothetical protein